MLLGAVGGAMLLGGAPVGAQDQGQQELEEVVVTGLRGSLKASMEMKRDAVGVVDAINAEDIGKFPDTNLAESLQRISGVSIDRVNGEGSRITARGFGPGFNLVTLNGRTMPTADVVVVGSGGSVWPAAVVGVVGSGGPTSGGASEITVNAPGYPAASHALASAFTALLARSAK